MNNLILYGMRGSWKTTIGKLLAEKLWYQFYDLDIAIQEDVKMSVFTLVEMSGWDVFRQREHEVLRKIIRSDGDKVVSLGWWAITFTNNQDILLKESEKLIYIECPLETIRERIERDESTGNKRNSLTGKWLQEELEEIYQKRRWCYESFYDFKVNNTTTPETCVASIVERLPYGKVCIPIIDFDLTSLQEQVHEINTAREIRMVELRIDFIDTLSSWVIEILRTIKKPVIVTNRSISEWWQFSGDIQQGVQKLHEFSQYWEYIDIELSAWKYSYLLEWKNLVLSYHNFESTPSLEYLIKKLNEMSNFNPHVYKIAVMPKAQSDLDIIYALQQYFQLNYSGKRGIFISMGDLWKETRVNIAKMGWWITFWSLQGLSAPGQIPYKELYERIFNA